MLWPTHFQCKERPYLGSGQTIVIKVSFVLEPFEMRRCYFGGVGRDAAQGQDPLSDHPNLRLLNQQTID
jgi:hypothetical protein